MGSKAFTIILAIIMFINSAVYFVGTVFFLTDYPSGADLYWSWSNMFVCVLYLIDGCLLWRLRNEN